MALARLGASVAALDIHPSHASRTVEMIRATGSYKAVAVVADVRCETAMKRAVESVVDQFGRIDILVASAAILRPQDSRPAMVTNLDLQDWRTVVDTNLKGPYLSNKSVLPYRIRQR